MRLATLRDGTKDGALCVVNKALTLFCKATEIANSLQQAIDHWEQIAPRLQELALALEAGRVSDTHAFDPVAFMAPLPRAYGWVDAGGYMSHMKRARQARGAAMPEGWEVEPAIYQGCSDCNLAGSDPISGSAEWGVDFESELAVIVGDVPSGCSSADASAHIRLIVLLNDVTLRNLVPRELSKGFGFFWSKPPSAFAPIAITGDELGSDWVDGKAVCEVVSAVNGIRLGNPQAGVDQQFGFPRIIEHAAKTRPLVAGTIVGAGTVSNYDEKKGVSCLVERRHIETIQSGSPTTPYLSIGDRVHIEAFDRQGKSLFGPIDQAVRQA
ncbi:2-keto-4-pentenoate hydratase [Caenimonas koreensis DSM 17982]|uniref:2-keto-4-pentenoate hydratase n=1 Tax=Caenimonas koreensis DSM 17982 TaxID=1121255 RepID=A0A844BDG6_9BURK|nr:fumarylacetoacetate hydrolase family protein [Caenimonas koreensis]MRD49749.1 2-keto-4-pentenoate hydratase [Caenimonas koreensis DSM 17982]